MIAVLVLMAIIVGAYFVGRQVERNAWVEASIKQNKLYVVGKTRTFKVEEVY